MTSLSSQRVWPVAIDSRNRTTRTLTVLKCPNQRAATLPTAYAQRTTRARSS